MDSENKYELLKLYIRNLSVESPLTGRLPRQINQPTIDINIDPFISRVGDNLYEVAARFTVSVHTSDLHLFLIELTQAGFFAISPAGEAQRDILLRRVFPGLIYPAGRANLVNFAVVAGYQPIVLDHIRLESLFVNTPIVDKREKPSEPAPLPAPAVSVVPDVQAELPLPALNKAVRPRSVEFAGVVFAVLLLALLAGWKYLPGFFEQTKYPAADVPPPVAKISVAAQPAISASASSVAQNEISGLPLVQLEQTGKQWVAAQEPGAFTVELARTDDLKKMEEVVPVVEGQPLYVVKLSSAGGPGHAVLSGKYGSEELARQAAANSPGYRVNRFGDYK